MTRFVPLSPETFRFVGFDDLSGVTKRVQSCGVLQDDLRIEHHSGAVFTPTTREHRSLYGGAMSADGSLIESTVLVRGGAGPVTLPPRLAQDAVAQSGTVLWLGWLADHFGHFLLEGLSRCWALAVVDPATPIVANLHRPAGGLLPVEWRLLSLLGADKDRFLLSDKPLRVDELIVPQTSWRLKDWYHPKFAETVRGIASRVVGGARASDQPLYLSRSRLPATRRTIMGERQLEERLEAAGVRVFHPQEHTIDEQILAVNQHRTIVATNGSAAHLLLFSLIKPTFHLLTQPTIIRDYFLVPTLAEAHATYVNCLSPTQSDRPRRPDMEMNIAVAWEHLVSEQLVGLSW